MIYVVINHYILNKYIEDIAIKCIKSFKKYDCKIVSVDDRSPIRSDEIRLLSDVWIPLEKNVGFAGSANKGIQWVLDNDTECWIVYANNDIEVQGDWIGEAERCFKDFEADMVGGLGYRIKDFPIRNDMVVSEGGRFQDWMFPGGFYITTDSFFRKIGVYDEGYRHGGVEDIDLFWRAKKVGKRLIMTPRIQYFHVEGATRYSETQKDIQSKAITKNEAYFVQKWGFDPIKELNSKILQFNPINP